MKKLTINEKLKRISELRSQIIEADESNADGRHIVVICCTELNNLIEVDYINVGAVDLIPDMYEDLNLGNFAEPYMCYKKKSKFELYARIYEEKVAPKLNNLN